MEYLDKNIKYLLLLLLFGSCNAIYIQHFGRPGLLELYHFSEKLDSLRIKTDQFVEESPSIIRKYNKEGIGYDDGKYRKYTFICNKDTLYTSIVFLGNDSVLYPDSIRRIGVPFIRFKHGVVFNGGMDPKIYRKNKAEYDSCVACFKKVFLNPLREELGENDKDLIILDMK